MLLLLAVAACGDSSSAPLAERPSDVSSTTPPPGTTKTTAPPSSDPPAPGEPGEPPVAPTPEPAPNVPVGEVTPLFVGRFDTRDPAGPIASWPGSRILVRFEGTDASVRFREIVETWMEGAPSYWEVRVDGGEWTPFAMVPDGQAHDFAIAKGLPPGAHTIELYKRSEMQTGMTQLLGFDLHGGTPLAPPPRQTRKIEVMGDSQTTGFGIEMLNAPNHDCPGADHGGRWQNFRKAWGARLGERFDAEVHGIAYSGKGLVQNVWPTDFDTLSDYYPRANPNPAIANSNPPLFDLQSWVPDVVVLAQGAMDFNSGVDYDVFRTGYRKFVMDTLRGRGPNTHIYMSVVGRGGRGSIDKIAREIIDERAAAGDHKMHVFVAKDYVWTEMVACNGHGTPEWHQRIADEVGALIAKDLGW
ncbi:MAG: hypothetical protein KIT84_08315 [Labilithrix sp.]|nr:hypothetical protein [Labilithrix sp.]MCW5811001.1 hypothetical protein [Labilithrix sp.]